MQYQLRDGLSFCFVDEHPVFLDIRNDRYFMLPAALECAFTAHINGQIPLATSLSELLGSNEQNAEESLQSRSSWGDEPATRSAMEEQTADEMLSIRVFLEVLLTVIKIRIHLKTMGLEDALRDLATHRKRKAILAEAAIFKSIESSITTATKQFLRARRLVPIKSTCLLDSLALATYLANRRLPAKLVFGVMLSPFSAHCWVQFRDIALNETVTETAAHTQILVW
ncbi:lasso peptide biosynthesis B2 protein [Pseudoxanthomonas wuyuanensis]|uniref:Transglutaminase-like superfamily protein n=1 Tax=Pseudoxanthomonas wuyuanensis TaxID=1073196 RepID=A0A286DBJ5_9GAMM|nr:lasso peptide biosynthesis B2 protein [Pseudoxanthomonas wuyuanensis]KAF1721719.1 hypothetical protein CSC75_05755 [Pseudoxanthomonas wuyuanensis]SOD56044.1 Transglutaminase-like superfamily protein [Pseudoxanthomonas wuyuanensis]